MLTIELASDALAADNRVILLPDVPRPVSAAVRVKDARLKQAAERALISSGRILFDKDKPQLVFTDTQQEIKGAPFWQLVLTPPEQPKLLRGPYLLDHTQPLLEGVSLQDRRPF
jgi:hypothetical protein